MCEKTKTVFGCGHAVKTLQDCGLHCSNPNRWSFEKSKDCSDCKAGGISISRGADGRGRYGRQLTQPREKPSSSTPLETPLVTREQALDPELSPWADVERPGHKSWDSPTRRRADEAWLVEHEDRMSDLQEKMYNMSCSPQRTSSPSPRDSYERIVQLTDDEEDDEIEIVRSSRNADTIKVKKIVYELSDDSDRYASKGSRRSERSGRRRRVNSEDSMPYYIETPRSKVIYTKRTTVPISHDYDVYDGYDTNRRSSRRHGSKTEPSYARSVIYDSTVSGSPRSAGHFTNYERIHIPRSDVRYQRKHAREHY